MKILLTSVALAALAAPSLTQISDLQAGRNFPTATNSFGTGRSENVDVGDIDNDGDMDVGVANGGDGSAQDNRVYVNRGNMQAGTEGEFLDESEVRLAGAPTDTSRDIEFADFDGDFDLDMYISNRGTTINNGEVSRSFQNQGGAQLSTIGFFLENTDVFWGNLVSVPLEDEAGVQDGQGPFRDFSCDCDFGDLDNDGDLDLFHSTYGPNLTGNKDSLIFLNDGAGTFNELSPWVNAGADIQLITLDIDLADFDGDMDIDVFGSSRGTQARVYRNNFAQNGWAGDPFTDITQTALFDQDSNSTGGQNYEAEFGDLDGDGDFDVWGKNWNGFTDRILINDGNFNFTQNNALIAGDPNVDENEVDFFDYDGDGDLDTFAANFSGLNSIYQGGLNQGVSVYNRNGTAGASWPEAPALGNGGTTLDGECADIDGDGDPDLLLANDSNQPNVVWFNVLGIPDTHAPTFFQWTNQGDKADGTDTVVVVQIRDNNNYYNIDYYNVDLLYSVNGGTEACVDMFAMRGQQFRAVIPGGINGSIAYRIRAEDDAGNTATSATRNYVQTSSGAPLWEVLGCGTPGTDGRMPSFTIKGTQTLGQDITLQLTDAKRNSVALLWISLAPTFFNAAGGTLFAFPADVALVFNTGGQGGLWAQVPWGGSPVGTNHYWQCIVQDAGSIHGLTLSNGVHGVQP
jgi:hypothetical protein